MLQLGLEGVTEVYTDRKTRFVSLKVTPTNDRVFCFYAPLMVQHQETADQGTFL